MLALDSKFVDEVEKEKTKMVSLTPQSEDGE